MAFNFDELKPEAKRAAFAHMRLGSGGRHKRLTAKKKRAVEHGGKGTVSGKLGSGSVKGQLTAADHDKGSMAGKLPVAKARPSAAKRTAPEPAAKARVDPYAGQLSKGHLRGEKPTAEDQALLASRYLEMHGDAGVQKRIAQLSARKRLGPGERAQLAALKSLGKGEPSAPKAAASKPSAPAKPAADTPEARFDNDFTDFMRNLTSKRSSDYASMVEVRKDLDARGIPRAEQDAHLKRMSREGKLTIVPEDNRKALVQEDHDAAIRIGGEPNHLVTLADSSATERAKLRAAAKPEDRFTGTKNLSARAPEDSAALAKQFVETHGIESVAPRIAFLEKKKRLLPGERAQLAALKTLGKK